MSKPLHANALMKKPIRKTAVLRNDILIEGYTLEARRLAERFQLHERDTKNIMIGFLMSKAISAPAGSNERFCYWEAFKGLTSWTDEEIATDILGG